MRKFSVIGALVALLVTLVALPAAATPPLEVGFEVPTILPDEGPSFGPFTASGPAVDAGLMCETGQTVDVFGKLSGLPAPTGLNIQVIKLFTCDDDSGDFLVKLQVRIDKKGDNFNWVVLSGTGDYADLHGTGSGIGIPPDGDAFDVLDLYDGRLHID